MMDGWLERAGNDSRKMTQTEDENNFSEAEGEKELKAGIEIVKEGRGAMRKLIIITGKQGVRVQFLLEDMLLFYSHCNHPLFFPLPGCCVLSVVQE